MKFNFAQQIRTAGWSESYDLGYADIPTAQAAAASISAFMSDRVQCLGAGPLLVSAVLSAYVQPLAPGAAPVRRNTVPFPVPAFPTPAGRAYNKAFNKEKPDPADFAPTVYYLTLATNPSTAPVYRRNCWIAGLPDVSDESDSPLIVDPATNQAVNKFIGDLNNSNGTLGGQCNVSIRSVDRSGANLVKPCTAWNLGPNTYTVPNHGFVTGQPVLAEGMRVPPGGQCPRGRYLIGAVIDVNTIALQDTLAPSAPSKLGGFRAAVVTFNKVTVCIANGFTKRDKGGPFGRSVGRRRRSVTRRS